MTRLGAKASKETEKLNIEVQQQAHRSKVHPAFIKSKRIKVTGSATASRTGTYRAPLSISFPPWRLCKPSQRGG